MVDPGQTTTLSINGGNLTVLLQGGSLSVHSGFAADMTTTMRGLPVTRIEQPGDVIDITLAGATRTTGVALYG